VGFGASGVWCEAPAEIDFGAFWLSSLATTEKDFSHICKVV